MNAIDASAVLQQAARGPERETRPGQGATAPREKSAAPASSAASVARPAQPPERKDMEALLQRLDSKNTSLSFQVDDESGRTVILVRDSVTAEVIKQIPSEDMLRVAQRLEAHLDNLDDGVGLLLTDEV